MWWLTFGWPLLMLYWLAMATCVVPSGAPAALACGGVAGAILLIYMLNAMILWIGLVFDVFGATGNTCAHATGSEAGGIGILIGAIRIYYVVVGIQLCVVCSSAQKLDATRRKLQVFAGSV